MYLDKYLVKNSWLKEILYFCESNNSMLELELKYFSHFDYLLASNSYLSYSNFSFEIWDES